MDDADLAEINGRISIGRLVRASGRQLLFIHHVVAEGLTRGLFRDTLSTSSKEPMSWTDKSQSFSHSLWK